MEDQSPKKTSEMAGKGGFRAASFIYALVSLEGLGFVANMVSLVIYFQVQLFFQLSAAATTVTNMMGATFMLSIFGGFISDTYIDRFKTTVIFGVLEVLGLLMMTLQARSKDLQPSFCGKANCMTGGVAVMFYASLSLLAIGSGGVRGALPALGADQFNYKVNNQDPDGSKAMARYFNFLLLSTVLGSIIGVTVVVWLATNHHWWPGFLVSVICIAIGLVFLCLGKPFYRLKVPGESPILRIIQVIVVAIKNRRLAHPEDPHQLFELNEKESSLTDPRIQHTQQFKWLDKAAILPEDSDAVVAAAVPWKVCTVTQVEEAKVLTRMLPIIASTIILNTCMAQLQTFSVTQGFFMNRFIGKFEVPAPSVPVIPLFFMSVLLPVYEFAFVPLARKFTRHPGGITQLQRVGVGLVLSVVSMAAAGFVEVKRKNHDIRYGKPMHVIWLSFQYGIFGIADMFSLVGLLEFFYKEAPTGMKSLSTSFTWLSISLGYFVSSIFVEVINAVTRRTTAEKRGWLEAQLLDQNHLDYFFWFLAVLSLLNFFHYLYWASWYQYKQEARDEIGFCETQVQEKENVKNVTETITAVTEKVTMVSGVEDEGDRKIGAIEGTISERGQNQDKTTTSNEVSSIDAKAEDANEKS